MGLRSRQLGSVDGVSPGSIPVKGPGCVQEAAIRWVSLTSTFLSVSPSPPSPSKGSVGGISAGEDYQTNKK